MKRTDFVVAGVASGVVLVVASCDGEIRLAGQPSAAPSSVDGATAPADASTATEAGRRTNECSAQASCRFGVCDVAGGVCVECVAEADCAAREGRPRCDVASHRCVACGLTADCSSGAACEPTTHRCVPTCGSCPSDFPYCDGARGICVACRGDADCSSDRRCDVAGGRCVACLADANCRAPDRPRCDSISGLCVGCITSPDCPANAPVCDPTELECQGE